MSETLIRIDIATGKSIVIVVENTLDGAIIMAILANAPGVVKSARMIAPNGMIVSEF